MPENIGLSWRYMPCVAMCSNPVSAPFSRRTSAVACFPMKRSGRGNKAATDSTSVRIWGARSSGIPRMREVRFSLAAFCWQRAKWSVRHEDQMPRAEMRAQRRDQFPIEGFQMTPGGTQHRLLEALRVGVSHAKFRKLEPE